MFDLLGNKYHVYFRQTQVKQCIEPNNQAIFEGCRRRYAPALWEVSPKNQIKRFDVMSL